MLAPDVDSAPRPVDIGGVLSEVRVLEDRMRRDLCRDARTHRSTTQKWIPAKGPQEQAYYSKADVLLYGGEPGGGKSQLILGLAFNSHQRSLIMRRHYGELERLIDDALNIHGSRNGYSASPLPRLRISEQKVIAFRAAQHAGDEQATMGQGRDLLGIDEATHFAESQVRFLMGWVRTETLGQRCRTVLATNPPLTSQGLWVNAMFAPWLDPNFPKPAAPGELRFVVTDEDGKDLWVDGANDIRMIRGKAVRPTSRTFIPASVKDNPYYAATDYERQLDALPEPYRTHLMGGFRTTFRDADFQVIPAAWIVAAQERWRADGFRDFGMTAMGYDPAGGGADSAELCWRHGGWYAPLVSTTGRETADGSSAAGVIISKRRNGARVAVFKATGTITDNTTFQTMPVTYVSGAVPANNTRVALVFVPAGATGAIGGSTGATDNVYLRADGVGGTTLQAARASEDDFGKQTINFEHSSTNTVVAAQKISRTSSGTPATGIGVRQEFEVETAAGNLEVAAAIDVISTDVTGASEDFDLSIKLMAAGAAVAEVFRVLSTGVAYLGGVAAAIVLKANGGQTLTGGFKVTPFAAGTKSSGTYTPLYSNGNFQTATNGGAHALAPPADDCTIIIQYTNNASAGAVTTSGFSKVTGSFTATNGDDFFAYITKVGSFSHLNIAALQ